MKNIFSFFLHYYHLKLSKLVYLCLFEELNNSYTKDNNRENVSNIVKLASDIRDSELEIFSEESFLGGIHIVSSDLLSIVEADNKSTMNMLNSDNSRFLAYVTELEKILDVYHERCNNLKNAIYKLEISIKAIDIVLSYTINELKLDKNKLDYFSSLNIRDKKQILLSFAFKDKKEDMDG